MNEQRGLLPAGPCPHPRPPPWDGVHHLVLRASCSGAAATGGHWPHGGGAEETPPSPQAPSAIRGGQKYAEIPTRSEKGGGYT